MSALVLDDDGTRWGDLATDWQRADAESILTGTDPLDRRLHFLTRPRNGSKTTDLAGVLIVVLLTQAPRRSTSHGYARDADQAAILLDEFRALVERTGLRERFDFASDRVTVKATRAVLRIESADAGSAYGRRPFFVVADELGQWPATREAQTLWQAVTSGLVKRPNSRFVTMTSAGDPSHWSARVLDGARTSDRWRVSEVPGPLAWVSEADLREQQRILPASVYQRLHLNIWSASEDRLVDPEDLRACVMLDGPLEYNPHHRYVIGVDLGLKHDATVLAVTHAERQDNGLPRVVLDRMHVMQGTARKPVQLGDVEEIAKQMSGSYGHARIRLDPWQGVGLAQRLRNRGVNVEEFAMTTQSVGRIGQTLHLLLRDRRVSLPDDPDLLNELMTVRLRENAPGSFRLDHDSGNHDDRAMALGLAALALVEATVGGEGGWFSSPREVYAGMQERQLAAGGPGTGGLLNGAYAARPIRGALAAVHGAQRAQTPAQRLYGVGLPVEGSENSPNRVHRT